jgi:PhzF family phenazine biosynthesis protein
MTCEISLYQVDAFTSRAFAGNPAAVCPLQAWLPDPLMQAIAAENNLSETAFFVPSTRAGDTPTTQTFDLRWFTPTNEIDLCGHATLASAFVATTELDATRTRVAFHTHSGLLTVSRAGDLLEMDFPARPALPAAGPMPELAAALGAAPTTDLVGKTLVAVFDDAATVRALRPDMAALAALDTHGVIVTAPGTGADQDVDFVSRYFAPRQGVPEDPVTGSAHCTLTPYWAARLGRERLHARQVSRRGGELTCTLRGDRVGLAGHAVLVIRGTLRLPSALP